MGQKANLISLRFSQSYKLYSRLNFQEFLYSFLFLKILNFLFLKKKIFLTNSLFFFVENKIFLTCFLFFRVVKLSYFNKILKKKKKFKKFKKKFKKKIKKNVFLLYKKKSRKTLKIRKFNKFKNIFNNLKLFKNNLIIFTFVNLNIYLKKKKKKVTVLFKHLKNLALPLFPRRFNFFLDFVQLSILFLENKIEIKFFISIICEIFRILQKKMHSKFFIFINKYFQFLVSNSFNSSSISKLLGIKFCINGKLKGKPRSNNFMFVAGTVPIQSVNASIDYAKSHAFTIYGVFGIKIWVYRK